MNAPGKDTFIRQFGITAAFIAMSGYDNRELKFVVIGTSLDSPNIELRLEGDELISSPSYYDKRSIYTPFGAILEKWMDAAQVTRIEDMVGRVVRVEYYETLEPLSKRGVLRVGHVTSNQHWFSSADISSSFKDWLLAGGGQE